MVAGLVHHTAAARVLGGPEIVGYVGACVVNHCGPSKMVALSTQYETVIFATMEAYDQASLRNFVFKPKHLICNSQHGLK